MADNKRNSGIELLRIIGMFFICFYHCRRVFHLDDFVGSAYILNYIPYGHIGNLIFIIISNYFLVDSKKFKISKIKTIIIDQFVISMLVVFMTVFLLKKPMDLKTLFKQIFILLYGGNWFITIWLIYYLIHPFLNIITDKLSKMEFTIFVLLLIIFYGFLMIIPSNEIPKGKIIDFIVLHFFVSYCKKYYDDVLKSKIGNVRFLIISSLVFVVSIRILLFLTDVTKIDLWGSGGYRTYPPMVIMVLSLFYIFKNVTFHNLFVNELGSLCLLHYMIHENYYFKKYRVDWLAGKLNNITYMGRHGYLLVFTVCYFLIVFLFAFIYKKIKSIVIDRIIHK